MHWYRVSSCMAVLMLLFLLPCLGPAAGSQLVSFVTVKKCPTADASPLRHRLASKLQCAAACSRLPTCNAFHFNITTRLCYHGDACSQVEQWTDGDCDSYKYTDELCGDCESSEPLVKQLKLKLFYKFSRSGLKNEVNPRLSCLKAYDVTIDAAGAHFKGNTSSYLSTETPGFEKLLGSASEYSMFFQVKHVFDSSGRVYYHRFLRCGTELAGILFYKLSSKFTLQTTYLLSNGTVLGFYYSSPSSLPTDGLQHQISIGFAFGGLSNQRFFLNDSVTPAGLLPSGGLYSPSDFGCLHLGQGTMHSSSLSGSMSCYGMSTKMLSLKEFEQIRKLCDSD